ncbi:hypothetical protein ACFQ07_02855 [Actinomadura adrarensis]|uniref:Uncharacterized protein n=1 Tax=Actinomadura adrarensis TaxID=1819600 RepID=A0ABW3C9G3_9ACTN
MLNVVRAGAPHRSVEVECARVGHRWWYLVVGTGEGVVPVDEVEKAPEVLLGILDRDSK